MTTRKSARIAEQQDAAIAAAESARQAKLASERAQIVAPARNFKKRKVANTVKTTCEAPVPDDFRKVKGRRGALKTMTEMPVDILVEIFSQLLPIDLLHLSRATKDLRAIILGPHAKYLWVQAYNNVPQSEKPPPCPPGLKSHHYTSLLYGRNCHACASTPASVVHWCGRIRLCSKCAPEKLILQARTGDMYKMCSSMHFRSGRTLYAGWYVVKAQYDRHVRRYSQLRNEEAKVQYKKDAEADVELRLKFGNKLEKWNRKMSRSRDSNIESIRQARRLAIIERIQKEGYSAELNHFRVDKLPGVNLAREFSDKEWEKIKGEIIPVLQYQRQENTKRTLIADYRWRIQLLSKTVKSTMGKALKPSVFPPISDYARVGPFCNLIKDPSISNNDLPKRFEEHTAEILKFAASWKVESDRFLRKLLKGPNSHPKGGVDVLKLAVTFFKCRFCNDPITYPRILMHACLRDKPLKSDLDRDGDEDEDNGSQQSDGEGEMDGDDGEEMSYKDEDDVLFPVATPENVWNYLSSWYGSAWNEGKDNIFVDEEATALARAIVKACGEDPDTVTSAAMEGKDFRLKCVRCSGNSKQKSRKRLVMNWKAAVLHDLDNHFEDPPSDDGWKLLTDEEDIAKTKETEAKSSIKWRKSLVECVHCGYVMTKDNSQVDWHISGWHRTVLRGDLPIDDWVREQTYSVLDVPMKGPPYPVKI